ncbi:hypothetical protein [Lactiplantibacillus paraxiangfangensis]|uniref:hypothetical protein n=1 Tax=Lactiplantibacillus paraxiangfangensis TaxID=3076224 RepID=UPI0030C6930A
MKRVKSVSLGLLLVMMGTVLVGCSSGEITATTDETSSSQVERSASESEEDEASSSSENDKVPSSSEDEAETSSSTDEKATSSSEDETETSSSSTSASSESQATAESSSASQPSTSVTTASSSAVTPAPRQNPGQSQGDSGQVQPHTNGVPDHKVSTAGDPRIWGNPRTKLYYTPAQNYRGFRPRHAVPFDNEAAAKAAGYVQSSRRPR